MEKKLESLAKKRTKAKEDLSKFNEEYKVLKAELGVKKKAAKAKK
jgi:hypothetical protein